MLKAILNFASEPKDVLYRELITHALVDCDKALLVVQTLPLEQSGQEVLARLATFLTEKAESSEWPGTRLFGQTAWVLQYRFEPGCAEILAEATDGLFGWMQPRLPEDLCLLRADGTPWMVSIAHEKDGYLELFQEEKERLFDAVPELISLIEEEPSGWPCGEESGKVVTIQSQLAPIESEALRWLLAGEHPVLGALREQLASACVLRRTLTGRGFSLKFSVPSSTTKLHEQFDVDPDFCIGDVTASIDALEEGADFSLWITDGLLDLLEGSTYDESWPAEAGNFSFEYTAKSKRDISALNR